MKISTELLNDEHYEYNINTGYIHSGLSHNWSNYSLELFEDVEWKLEAILWHKKKFTVPYNEEQKNYLEGKRRAHEFYLEQRKKPGEPRYMEYFMQPQGEGLALISYSENCILTFEEDEEFDYFFALKMSILDLMDLHEFLEYQITANFKDDKKKFKRFLQTMLIKYQKLFETTSIPKVVNNFISEELISETETVKPDIPNPIPQEKMATEETKKDDTTSRQHVIALHYLFEAMEITNYDRTALARFVQFLNGKEKGAKSIINTSIYAFSKDPFGLSPKELTKTLEAIRPFFKELGLITPLELLDKKLESISSPRKNK